MCDSVKSPLLKSGVTIFETPLCDFYIEDGRIEFDIITAPRSSAYVRAADGSGEILA